MPLALLALKEILSAVLFASDVYTDLELLGAVRGATKNATLCEDTCGVDYPCDDDSCHSIDHSLYSDADCWSAGWVSAGCAGHTVTFPECVWDAQPARPSALQQSASEYNLRSVEWQLVSLHK